MVYYPIKNYQLLTYGYIMKNFIKRGSPFFLIISFLLLSVSAYSNSLSGDNDLEVITKIDHKTHSVRINDKSYFMLIQLEVFFFDGKTRKKEQVNRYALKVGQTVNFTSEVRKRQSYLSEITILR
jgi:hypothetical protein